ncbi:LysR family transcriptional regulator [Pseudonocardia sp. N23]|uniref:LysR family transcriptional regulator n=1 Tax=Pseudonocardia sp. N23 TaxID=1987376 RepID=UPI000BFD0DA2|nr:LysR substrate-binding domain-containing protein [Pseudonocardia sp. N23]GAY07268.1 transcriptional regulator, LysR family [Pseudonocardia sp. N23]
MDLRALECFLAVADEGSISRAATSLHMTQPPLTVRLQNLERELGVALLVRHGRGVDLTAAGRLLAERTRRLLGELALTTDMVRAVGSGTHGSLGVAAGRTVSPQLLPRLVDGATLGPDVDLVMDEVADSEVVERVHRRDAHVGLLHLPPVEPGRPRHVHGRARGLEVAVVAREPLVAVLPEGHPAAGSERVDLADLQGPRIMISDRAGEGFAAHARAAWADATRGDDARREVSSVMHALALVEAGAGITLLPAQYLASSWPGVRTRPLRRYTAVVETAALWRADEDTPVLKRFLRAALSTPEPDVLGPPYWRDRRATEAGSAAPA